MLLGGDGYARTLPHVLVQKYRIPFDVRGRFRVSANLQR